MIVTSSQRWLGGRDSYVPARTTIVPRDFEVATIADDKTAKAFVCEHHYSGSFPAARERFGLYTRRGQLVGVAVFSVPVQPRALDVAPGDRSSCVELGRLVLLDEVAANGESWMLGRCFELLRGEGYTGLISFSDPTGRTTARGEVVFAGHVGTIYQATNATYVGRSKAETRRLLPDGSLLHGRTLTKIRKRERGWRYASAKLVAFGASPLRDWEEPADWLDAWVPALTRKFRHPGNHKYAWALRKRDRRHLPESLPYPKVQVAA